MIRVLVTGGRFYADKDALWQTLDRIHAEHGISEIAHGACHLGGADKLAGEWAEARGVTVRQFPVDHAIDGPWPAAGPRRNRRMFIAVSPHLVVAAPGDRGTRNMRGIADEFRCRIVDVKKDSTNA